MNKENTPKEWRLWIETYKRNHSPTETLAVLKTATTKYIHDYSISFYVRLSFETYQHDPDLVKIWIDLIRLRMYQLILFIISHNDRKIEPHYEEISNLFRMLKSARVGIHMAQFHLLWAEFEIKSQHPHLAKNILTTAISLQVQPIAELREALTCLISSLCYIDKENVVANQKSTLKPEYIVKMLKPLSEKAASPDTEPTPLAQSHGQDSKKNSTTLSSIPDSDFTSNGTRKSHIPRRLGLAKLGILVIINLFNIMNRSTSKKSTIFRRRYTPCSFSSTINKEIICDKFS